VRGLRHVAVELYPWPLAWVAYLSLGVARQRSAGCYHYTRLHDCMDTPELPPEPTELFVPPAASFFAQLPSWLRRTLGWLMLAVFLVGLGGLIGGHFALWPGPQGALSAGTVWVQVGDGSREGSGVLISPNGLVLTAAHVVAGAQDLRVTLHPGTRRAVTVAARVTSWAGQVGAPRPEEMGGDWAVVRADVPGNAAYVALADADAAQGAWVYVAGVARRGGRARVSVETGTLTAEMPGPDGAPLAFNTDARIEPGMSGGPCADASGRLIGLCVMYSESASANLVLPLGRFRAVCREALQIYAPGLVGEGPGRDGTE
jgi:S1-C subfamily serine protease